MALANPLPPSPSPGSEEPGLKLRDVWGILLRNRWVILASAFVVAGAAVAYALKATRIYEASTTIRIEVKEPNLPGIFRAVPGQASEIGTEIQVLRSRSLIEDAVNQLGLQLTVSRPEGAQPVSVSPISASRRELFPAPTLLVNTGDGALELRQAVGRIGRRYRRVGSRLEAAVSSPHRPLRSAGTGRSN